jgi:hypothetical protein
MAPPEVPQEQPAGVFAFFSRSGQLSALGRVYKD